MNNRRCNVGILDSHNSKDIRTRNCDSRVLCSILDKSTNIQTSNIVRIKCCKFILYSLSTFTTKFNSFFIIYILRDFFVNIFTTIIYSSTRQNSSIINYSNLGINTNIHNQKRLANFFYFKTICCRYQMWNNLNIINSQSISQIFELADKLHIIKRHQKQDPIFFGNANFLKIFAKHKFCQTKINTSIGNNFPKIHTRSISIFTHTNGYLVFTFDTCHNNRPIVQNNTHSNLVN